MNSPTPILVTPWTCRITNTKRIDCGVVSAVIGISLNLAIYLSAAISMVVFYRNSFFEIILNPFSVLYGFLVLLPILLIFAIPSLCLRLAKPHLVEDHETLSKLVNKSLRINRTALKVFGILLASSYVLGYWLLIASQVMQ